ncbi:MAG: STAS domain-containing protein [Leptospiraceae bacterium]|nr:STAS domain-containing protein [Leptospiraceae bacterium]
MRIKLEQQRDLEIIIVEGDVDLYSAPSFKEHIAEFLSQGKRKIILDMRKAPLIDSSGLAVVLNTALELQKTKQKLRVVVSKQNHTVFRFFSIDKRAILTTTLESALDSFSV